MPHVRPRAAARTRPPRAAPGRRLTALGFLGAALLLPACAGPSRRTAVPPPSPPPQDASASTASPPPTLAAPPPSAGDSAAELAAGQVRAVLAALARADSAEDLQGVLALWHDDAQWLGPDGRHVVGKPAVRAEYETLFAQYDLTVEIDIDEIELDPTGRVARVHGVTRVQRAPRAGGETEEWRDRYIMGLLREGDAWRILRLVWQPLEE